MTKRKKTSWRSTSGDLPAPDLTAPAPALTPTQDWRLKALAWTWWAPALFAGVVLAAKGLDAFLPMFSGEIALLLLPLALLPGILARSIAQTWQLGFFACAIAWLCWQLGVSLAHPPFSEVAAHHWLMRAVVVVYALAGTLAAIPLARAMRLVGWAGVAGMGVFAACGLTPLIAHGWLNNRDLVDDNLMFGNVSWMVNIVAPALMLGLVRALPAASAPLPRRWGSAGILLLMLAIFAYFVLGFRVSEYAMPSPWWFVLILALAGISLWWLGRDTGPQETGARTDAALNLVGLWLLGTFAVATSRRGLLAFALLLGAYWLWEQLRRHRPRLAWSLFIATVVGSLVMGMYVLLGTQIGRHDERLILLRAACESVMRHPWCGTGDAGTLRITLATGDYAGYSQCFSLNIGHTHNEPLEALVQGGLIGFALITGLAVWLVVRVLRMRDARQRLQAMTLLIGMAIPALSDPSWSRPLAACAFGGYLAIVLRCLAADQAQEIPSLARRCLRLWADHPVRVGCAAICVAAAWMAVILLPAAGVQGGTLSRSDHLALIQNSCDFGTIVRAGSAELQACASRHEVAACTQTIAAVDRAIGPATWGYYPFSTLAALSPRADERVQACLDGIALYPFEVPFYVTLQQELSHDPSLAVHLPPRIAQRLNAYAGTSTGKAFPMTAPVTTFADGADRYAEFTGHANSTLNADRIRQIGQLVQRYRKMTCMSALVFNITVLADASAADELLKQAVNWHMQPIDPVSLKTFLAFHGTHEQDERIIALLDLMYPAEVYDARAALAHHVDSSADHTSVDYLIWDYLRRTIAH